MTVLVFLVYDEILQTGRRLDANCVCSSTGAWEGAAPSLDECGNVDKTQLEVIPRSVAVNVPNFGGLISSATTVLALIIPNQRQH